LFASNWPVGLRAAAGILGKRGVAGRLAAVGESRALAFFAGLWTRRTSVRKVKEGETTIDLFGFQTTEPNAEVKAVHQKSMPVISDDASRRRDMAVCADWRSAGFAEAASRRRT
jgi:hypothetical protein